MKEPPARKSLGQHFLHQKRVIELIVQNFNPQSENVVVEIGPGRGALTFELAPKVKALHIIEIDTLLAKQLEQTTAKWRNVVVHYTDALEFDYCIGGAPVRVIGNLPYNISTPLLFRLLEYLPCIEDMVLMLQKEVVDRMTAAPGSKTYGRLSVMVQQKCLLSRVLQVSRGAFKPPPKVDSTVVSLRGKPDAPALYDEAHFSELVRRAFSQRRKTLRNSLRNFLSADQILACGVEPTSRPEQLSVEEFEQLSNRWAKSKT